MMPSRRALFVWTFVIVLGCGGDDAASEHEPQTASPAEPVAVDPAEPASAEPEPPPTTPVDLLHAVPTDIAASSAFRDHGQQVAWLADGDTATAWNSRSGDLVGAWIEVRLPDAARVTSIRITSGFSGGDDTDVFAGNHRIASLRVSRAGTELGVFALDTDSRELQSLPVTGPGGVYRLEVLELTPGTRDDWQETCVAELRVMGTAPDVQPAARFPRWSLRELPTARPAPGATPRAEVRARFDAHVQRFTRAWRRYENARADFGTSTGLGEPTSTQRSQWTLTRRRALLDTADLLDHVDGAQADALRRRAAPSWGRNEWVFRVADDEDFDPIAAGIDAVAEWLDDDEARCRWASAHTGLRLQRISLQAQVDYIQLESQDIRYAEPEEVRNANLAERVREPLGELDAAWLRSPRQSAARLARVRVPDAYLPSEAAAMRAALTTAQRTCVWDAPEAAREPAE